MNCRPIIGLRPCLLLACHLLLAVPAAAATNFDKGMDALLEGNYAEAYCLWKPLALNGHAEAQYNLGWLYANGNGLKIDTRLAVQWWAKAAAQGHLDAQFALGMAYMTGEGIQKDISEAMRWFVTAANLGLEDAREIVMLLADDPSLDLVGEFPQLLGQKWFGRPGKIRNDAVNVRAEPGREGAVLTRLRKGDAVRIIRQRKDWSLAILPKATTQHSVPATGWIFSSLIDTGD